MRTANIELCKELYQLSKWEAELTWAATNQDNTLLVNSDSDYLGHNIYRVAYAYDLSLLLRKLPSFIETRNNAYRLKIVIRNLNDDKEAQIMYSYLRQVSKDRAEGFEEVYWRPDPSSRHAFSVMGNLEDAAAEACIELFKAGVLTTTEGNDLRLDDPEATTTATNTSPKPHHHKEG